MRTPTIVEGIELFPVPGTEFHYISKCAKVWRGPMTTTGPRGMTKSFRGKWVNPRIDDKGYMIVDVYKTPTAIHLLLSKTFLGWEKGWETDHINQNKLDNRLENLRVVELRLNRLNNKSRGTFRYGSSRKWSAYITIKGRPTYLGGFATEEEANAAYVKAKNAIMPTLTDKAHEQIFATMYDDL